MTALAETTDAAAPGRRTRPWVWLLVLPLGAWLAWRALAWGVAGWLVSDDPPRPERVHAALQWVPDHPTALFLAAQADQAQAPGEAGEHLRRLLAAHPGHAWGWMLWAELAFRDGRREDSRQALTLAQRLAPWDGGLHYRAGDLWVQLEDLPQAVAAWGQAMEAAPALRRELYPRLLRLVEYLDDASLLAPVAQRHPDWWPGFFRQAAQPPTSLELVRALYALQGGEAEGRTLERRVYLERLMNDGQWAEAYLTWLNDLDAAARRHLGLVFNSGFELPLSGVGFDWRHAPERLVKVERRRTYGISGDRALALQYKGRPVPDGHLAQTLLLPPGRYRLTYRARPDSLKAAEGLRVAVRCRAGDARLLAQGDRLLGVYQWRTDVLEWEVPESGCPAQELRLEVVTERQRNRVVKGALWLDDFRLRPMP